MSFAYFYSFAFILKGVRVEIADSRSVKNAICQNGNVGGLSPFPSSSREEEN